MRSPAATALLDRCERVAHHQGRTRHDVLHSLNDWFDLAIDTRAIEAGEADPSSDELAALHGALDQHVVPDDDAGLEHISAPLGRVLASLHTVASFATVTLTGAAFLTLVIGAR